MERDYYLRLAESGLRMPIGTDLVLHEQPDPANVLLDAPRLAQVIVEAARRYRTPLAVAPMDLMVEKAALLALLGVSEADASTWHFSECPDERAATRVKQAMSGALHPRIAALAEALGIVASETDLVAVGMCIGPFSLMTKLLADPITPVYMAGSGLTGLDEPEVAMVERVLELSLLMVSRSVRAQLAGGAAAIFIAEPAANVAYLSPRQMDGGSDVFDRYVMANNRAVKAIIDEAGADLMFHCCGELTDAMVEQFASLDPALLSLGASRRLWEDARLVPKRTVLFGNLPSKKFFSDDFITRQQVVELSRELLERMKEAGHPFILGSECDVLHVPGHEKSIHSKVEAFLTCSCQAGCASVSAD